MIMFTLDDLDASESLSGLTTRVLEAEDLPIATIYKHNIVDISLIVLVARILVEIVKIHYYYCENGRY